MTHIHFKIEGENRDTANTEVVKLDFGKLYGAWQATPRGQNLMADAPKKVKAARNSFEEQLHNGQITIDAVAASITDNNVGFQRAPMGQIFCLMDAVKEGKVASADIGSVPVRVPKDQVPLFNQKFAPGG